VHIEVFSCAQQNRRWHRDVTQPSFGAGKGVPSLSKSVSALSRRRPRPASCTWRKEGGFDFLGFCHRLVRSRGLHGKPRVLFLARWPADKAMQHARGRIRELTGRRRLLLPPEVIARDVNMFLRGWAGYFRYGHPARRLSKIRQYARIRIVLFISKRHRRSRHFGWQVMLNALPREFGLVSLDGTTVAPRAGKSWRERPNAGGERRR
jgi:RNA-directed DNA polymerase